MSNTSRQATTTLLDACAVLSLYATRRMAEILATVPGPVAVCDLVAAEALYVRRIVDGEREREPVDLAPLVADGTLSLVTADDEDELQTFVDLAVDLDDGEAMTAALAIHRGCVLVTDDAKAERLLAGRVQLRATLDVVKAWADGAGLDRVELRAILAAIYERGYEPPLAHPLKRWWDAVMTSAASS
jgi:predicted nucleic acid-binding protein